MAEDQRHVEAVLRERLSERAPDNCLHIRAEGVVHVIRGVGAGRETVEPGSGARAADLKGAERGADDTEADTFRLLRATLAGSVGYLPHLLPPEPRGFAQQSEVGHDGSLGTSAGGTVGCLSGVSGAGYLGGSRSSICAICSAVNGGRLSSSRSSSEARSRAPTSAAIICARASGSIRSSASVLSFT